MSYRPANVITPDAIYVHPLSTNGYAANLRTTTGSSPASGAYPAANRIHAYPFYLQRSYTIQRWWWLNGATVGTDNIQVGVYDENLNQISESASTLSAGTVSTLQYVTPGSPIALPPMRGYLAIWCSGTTATLFRLTQTDVVDHLHFIEAGGAGGLPATLTPASAVGVGAIFVFGFTSRSSP